MKKIYLASPFGFSKIQNSLLSQFVEKLEKMELEVWEPFSKNNQIDFFIFGWAYSIGQADKNDVENCDAIFAIVNGTPPDEGVMIELGMAIALNKKIFLFRDDFRKCTDCEEYPLNLMIFTGLAKENWKEYYFTDINQIDEENSSLWRWIKE